MGKSRDRRINVVRQQPPDRPRTARDAQERGPLWSGYRPGKLKSDVEGLAKILAGSSAEQLPLLSLPLMWVHNAEGMPANACVDAALTLQVAFAQFGIAARPWPVDLIIMPTGRGGGTHYGSLEPRWSGEQFVGHCVLWLPDQERFVDTTVMQFPEMARQGWGPLVGRTMVGAGQDWTRDGGEVYVPRGDYMLGYQAAGPEWEQVLYPARLQAVEQRRQQTGVNLASYALVIYRKSRDLRLRATTGPYPRLRQLMAAVRDAPEHVDDDGNYFFQLPTSAGGSRRIRLDEIDLRSK